MVVYITSIKAYLTLLISTNTFLQKQKIQKDKFKGFASFVILVVRKEQAGIGREKISGGKIVGLRECYIIIIH